MKPKQEWLFSALGGVGEIGKNLSIYGWRDNGQTQWLIVDCGITFPDNGKSPGVEVILPDVQFLASERKNIVGMIVTHAHEDHIGAILSLWPHLQCPVYASPFAQGVLRMKAAREHAAEMPPLHEIAPGQTVNVGPFQIEGINVAHSIPEAMALAITTPLGTVLHTGDWKRDEQAPFGHNLNEKRLQELGSAGVLAVIGDSTNAPRAGVSPSEAEVHKSLREIILSRKGRVALTTFSSHVGRISGVVAAAREAGRHVVVVGRAMAGMIQVAKECGYLAEEQEFLSPDLWGQLPPEKVVALVTGSQGEARAALKRIADDNHPDVTFSKGDTVILSSKTVPGNEKAVGEIVNALIEQGIEVITDRTHLVHVSGHPRAEEVKALYGWLKPKMALPVHGEALHQHEHALLAKQAGVKDVHMPKCGELIRLAPGKLQVIDHLPHGELYRDGDLVLSPSQSGVAERQKLAFAGAVFVSMCTSAKGDLDSDVLVETIGLPEPEKNKPLNSVLIEAIEEAWEALPRPHRRDTLAAAQSVEKTVRSLVGRIWGKKPLCRVHIHMES